MLQYGPGIAHQVRGTFSPRRRRQRARLNQPRPVQPAPPPKPPAPAKPVKRTKPLDLTPKHLAYQAISRVRHNQLRTLRTQRRSL